MDFILLFFGLLCIIIGIAGSLLPVLPGPLASWVGLLLLYLTKTIPTDWTFLGITLAIAIVITVVDNFIPILGTKKFGGTKYGIVGATIGLVVGLFFGPLGIIAGPFLGAFVGEIIKDSKDSKKALQAAFGSFVGFIASTLLKFIASVIFAGFFFSKIWEYKAVFFSF
jgi:hypothetical protein